MHGTVPSLPRLYVCDSIVVPRPAISSLPNLQRNLLHRRPLANIDPFPVNNVEVALRIQLPPLLACRGGAFPTPGTLLWGSAGSVASSPPKAAFQAVNGSGGVGRTRVRGSVPPVLTTTTATTTQIWSRIETRCKDPQSYLRSILSAKTSSPLYLRIGVTMRQCRGR